MDDKKTNTSDIPEEILQALAENEAMFSSGVSMDTYINSLEDKTKQEGTDI